MKLKVFAFFMLSFLSFSVYAASGHGEGIPWEIIIQQTVNVACVIALLVYLTKTPIASYFTERHEKYFEGVRRAQEAKEQAQQKKTEIEKKLKNLLVEAQNGQKTAQEDAKAMSQKMLADTEKMASKIKEEAFRTVTNELQKTKIRLRQEILEAALGQAHSGLETEVKKMEPGHFKKEFSQKMRVVQ